MDGGRGPQAARALERRYRTAATTPEERARRMRFLQGRGFSAEVIRILVSRRGERDPAIS
ncbi:MAG: RecX family transcriptional regulator [Burkholderiales bacterium]|nr:RecX family transcriptional regulator [Burkholderiales bacterium]